MRSSLVAWLSSPLFLSQPNDDNWRHGIDQHGLHGTCPACRYSRADGVSDPNDHEARDNLMWAATLAGMAFGNCGTHLPHAFSYAVTSLMHDVVTEDYPVPSPFVPHGISVILTSPSAFRFSAEGAPERHLEAAACLGADTRDATPGDAGEVVATRIIDLMRATQLPNGLQGIGFTSEDAGALTDSAMRQRRAIANAPRETTRDDTLNIFSDAMSYW